ELNGISLPWSYGHMHVNGDRWRALFFFSSRRRHTRSTRDWSSDVCSSDLIGDTLLNGRSQRSHVDVLAAYNAARDPDLSNAVTWAPFLVGEFHPTQAVAGVVRNTAGTFREEAR